MTITYAKRQTAFDHAEHQWRAEADALVWIRPGGESVTILWRDVVAVRAAFAPTRWKAWRHVLEIVTRQRLRLLIDNAHLRGVGDFEDRSEAFARFALTCIARIAEAAPAARGWLGAGWWNYLGQLGLAGAALLLLAVVLVALPADFGGSVLLKLGLIGAMLPLAAVWLVRSRPRRAPVYPAAFLPGLPEIASKLL
ncbi:MAG TPA: hypothetical protein VEA44_11845 [Caulobacter sp.]|nr:hypothetical protein [Caulobacter sp.]